MSMVNGDADPRVVQAVLDAVLPRITSATQSSIQAALARQRGWEVVPATIMSVNGPDAFVIPDDLVGGAGVADDEEIETNDLIQVTRLDEWQGVNGGVAGSRARTLLLRIPPHGGYCLGAIPDPRPDETAGSDGFFDSALNDSARAAGANTDMQIAMDLTAGYIYGVHLHARLIYGTSGAQGCDLDQDGTIIGRFTRLPSGTEITVSSWVNWIATEDIEGSVLTVQNSSGSVGTLQTAVSLTTRTLIGVCWGPARGYAIS